MLKNIFKLLIGSLIITLVIGSIFFTQLFDTNPNNLSKIYFYRWRSIPFNNKATTFLSYVSNNPQIDHIYFQKIRAKADKNARGHQLNITDGGIGQHIMNHQTGAGAERARPCVVIP